MNLQIKKVTMALLLSVFCFTAYAQKSVTGTVKDASGEPLIGVSVTYGNGQGTVTDIDGKFTINAAEGSTVKVSYVGFKPQTVKASANMSITL